jgi:hypothetical protein
MATVDVGRDLLDPWRQRIFNDIKVATVGRVTTFMRTGARAAVAVLSNYITSDGQERTPPPCPGAVVVQPRGDGYGVAFDVVAGDLGVLVAADMAWQQQWKAGTSAPPDNGLRHTYGGAALLPGGRKENEAPPNAVGSMRIGAEDGSACVDLTRTRGLPGSVVVSAAGPVASVKLGSAAAVLALAYNAEAQAAFAAGLNALNAAVQANPLVDPITVAQKAAFASGVTAAIIAYNAAMVGTSKTVAE